MSEFLKGFLAGVGVGAVGIVALAVVGVFALLAGERAGDIARMRADD